MATAPAARLDGQAWAEVTVDGATHKDQTLNLTLTVTLTLTPTLPLMLTLPLTLTASPLALPLPRRDAAGDDGDALITNY